MAVRLHQPNARPVSRLAGDAVARSPDPPRTVALAAFVRANLTTTAARTGMAIAAAGVALAWVGVVVDDTAGSGRIAVSVGPVLLLLLGGVLMLALPARLAGNIARLPAVRARVAEVCFDAASHDTLEATVNGMARGVAVLEPHPDCARQPQREERRFEVDEGWADQIAPGTVLFALVPPRGRQLVVLGIDPDVAGVEDR